MAENFFNIGNPSVGIPRKLAEGIGTNIFMGDNVMVSLVRCEPGAKGKVHSHAEEQWGVLLEGGGTRIQDGQRVEVGKGDFWRTPGNVDHGFEAGSDGALVLDIFSPPRDDYRKPGQGFGPSS